MELYMHLFYSFILLILCVNPAGPDEIRFKPGDTIEVTVFNSPEMNGSYRIHPDGNIRMPLLGKIPAAGKTEEELYQSISSSMSTFIKNPYITIIPRFTISVLGSVTRPGIFIVTGSEKPVELIAQAGGFNTEASGKITLYRQGAKYSITKKDVIAGDTSFGFLQPGDVLFADRRLFTRADYSIMISTISMISVSLYYFSWRNR